MHQTAQRCDKSVDTPKAKAVAGAVENTLRRSGTRCQFPPKRTRARSPGASEPAMESVPCLDRCPPRKGTVWNPYEDAPTIPGDDAKNRRLRPSQRAHRVAQVAPRRTSEPDGDIPELIKQPETRPISQEQLVAEVKGIYAGLIMVEAKCIEVDNAQNAQDADAGNGKLNHEQWQALIALHRTLLHEHHDFFLASQHPSASPALRRLASQYAMPARMWRHGIHSFLELLRKRLPASLEHMLAFIYLAYSMMALLYETVPAFEDTWIECLGDLGRYRMAIEDDDLRDREVWTAISRAWYSKSSEKSPTTGRLYHHLAILARPNNLQQLFYYTKSLCVNIPFLSARVSIKTLLDPIPQPSEMSRLTLTDIQFAKIHGIMFSGKPLGTFESSIDGFIESLDNYIERCTRRWLGSDCNLGVALCCAILDYGDDSPLWDYGRLQDNNRLSPLGVDNHKPVLSLVTLPAYSEDRTILEADERPLPISQLRSSYWLTKLTRVISSLSLVKFLRIYLPLAFVSLVLADPASAANRHRTPKLLLLGGSAISSLGTGMTSLQLELADDPHWTKVAKMSLRIACSTFLGILAVGYPLWFLPYAQKTQRFLSGLCGIGFFLWLFVRRDPASAAVETGDAFAWLDDLNLFGLIAVVAGILNAESSLMAAAFAQGRTDGIAADGGDVVNDYHRRRRADEESQDDDRNDARRRRVDDESRDDTRNDSGGFGLAVISSAAQAIAGA
ncbi:hypothetical protein CONLIGDRAFT_162006 [Coniochaeta ligniaria NRRL 30616]|uniref:DNA/RNA-binding domain-containing protein n=1 Tax=Coniochaeta ligniaria NRRL 30616 TaxID=1408157 RepID=A0A1J7IZZ3_9PEZI|nr:hypothetical protein CONLIGDRAFT_162006 [Coniochaeta ligniaria NRRL 30616]